MVLYSAPMPFQKSHIERIAQVNKRTVNHRIDTLYNSLPSNSPDRLGFELERNSTLNTMHLSEFIDLVSYAKNSGFDFIYLLNRMASHTRYPGKDEIALVNSFLEKLLKGNIKKLRISDPLLIDHISRTFPEFNIYCSTVQEYTSIRQYTNLVNIYPSIKGVVPSWDNNRNFAFIDSFKKLFPNIHLELMLNEGCISGCPFRRSHAMASGRQRNLFNAFFNSKCSKLYDANPIETLCLSNIIYPWDIEVYSNHGVNSFKFVGRNSDAFYTGRYADYYEDFLCGAEDFDYIKDKPITNFNHYLLGFKRLENVTVGIVKQDLPSIHYFEENHGACAVDCGSNCIYCYQQAEKIKMRLEMYMEYE